MLLISYVRRKNLFDHALSCNTTSFLVHFVRKIAPDLFVQKLCGLLRVVVDKKVFKEAEAASYICMSRSFLYTQMAVTNRTTFSLAMSSSSIRFSSAESCVAIELPAIIIELGLEYSVLDRCPP